MRPDCVRRICAGALALLIVCLASAHVKDILSEDVLDYTGYYDNLVGFFTFNFWLAIVFLMFSSLLR